MQEVAINKNDELVMKLLHFFITEEGYSPIILKGAKNEIWLENMENPYKIVRIVSNYIHNDEQLNFDLYRTKKIMKTIKRKTLSFQMNVLNFFINIGDNVNSDKYVHMNNVDSAFIDNIRDLKKYDFVKNEFPTITNDTEFKEEGMELFIKITHDITKKNEEESIKAENIFKMKKPIITYILIAINVIMFISMYLFGKGSQDNYTLIKFGANYGSLVKAGEYFRLITCAFLHIGIFHLLFNMYALYIIGMQLESFLGKTKYLIIYLFSAITASLMSIIFSNSISAGASGAIFGLFGSLLYFGYHYRVYLGNVIKSQIIPLIVVNLLLGFMIGGVDNAAHIGGLIGGALMTMALGVKYKSTNFEKINGWIVTAIYTCFLIFLGFFM